MIKLGIGFPYFVTDDKQINEVYRAIQSVSKHVYKVYAIDGRYHPEFTHELDYSISLCNKVIETFPNVEITKLCGHQLEKRQKYLDLAGQDDCDYLLVMDSDDYIHPEHNDWNLFYKQLEQHYDEPEYLYYLWFWVKKEYNLNSNPITPETWQKFIRIHKHPGEQKYYMNHYTWRLKDDYSVSLNSLPCKKTLNGIKLTSDSIFRSTDFIERSETWVHENWKKEQARTWVAFNKVESLSRLLFTNKPKQ